MQANRDRALKWLCLIDEDASVNRNEPASVGGISKYGVTLVSYRDWRHKHGQPDPTANDIANLTLDQAEAFYTDDFLPAIRFDELPSGVDYALLSWETNDGKTGGVKLCQRAVGLPQTGIMDENTLAAIRAIPAATLIYALSAAWLSEKHANQAEWNPHPGATRGYGPGWTNRAMDVPTRALTLTLGG